jgi:imidazolonepropionase-like amidohydrolase
MENVELTVIRNVRLPLMSGSASRLRYDVHVRRDRIERVEAAEGEAPSGAREIEGRGGYLMPGLVDSHVHFRPSLDRRRRPINNPADDAFNRHLARLYLANGVTSVYCMSGSRVVLRLRDAIAAGSVAGPSIYTTSPIQNDPNVTFRTARERVRRYRRAGYDSIKVYNMLTRAAFDGICHQAERSGMPVIGHIVRAVGPLDTLASYQSAVVHAECFVYTHFAFSNREPDDAEDDKLDIRRLPFLVDAASRGGVFLVATLQTFKSIVGQFDAVEDWCARPEMRYLPREVYEAWRPGNNPYAKEPFISKRLHSCYAFQKVLAKAFHDGGIPVLAGTDAMVPGVVPGFSLREEVSNLVVAGLSNREALLAATEKAGILIRDDGVGRVAAGCWADLLLLDRDPVTDVANLDSVRGVMARGRWYGEAALTGLLKPALDDVAIAGVAAQ